MTLIICAIKPEIKPFLKALDNLRVEKHTSLKVYCGTIKSKNVLVVRCGVGLKKAAAVTQLMIDNYKIERIIMSGTAGGVDNKLKLGDTVVSEEILYHEIDSRTMEDIAAGNEKQTFKADTELLHCTKKALENDPAVQSVLFGRITSGNKFVSGKNLMVVAEKFKSLCLDMETAAVAHVCSINSIPFISIRSISDTVDKSGFLTFFKNVNLASKNSFLVVEKLLSQK